MHPPSRQTTLLFRLLAAACGVLVATVSPRAEEYQGDYLYAAADPGDTGGILLELAPEAPWPEVAIAVGQRGRVPYLGEREPEQRRLRFAHLPVDKYDLVLVTAETVYEGCELVRAAEADPPAEERRAIIAELHKIEGFFDRKQPLRVAIAGTSAGTLLQQWRVKKAVKQSGAPIKGSIHSLDLIWFEKPLKGWQLTRRRQIYRAELPEAEPLAHVHVPELGGIRVIAASKRHGPVVLPPSTIPEAEPETEPGN